MKKILLINLIAWFLIGAIWSVKTIAGPPPGGEVRMIPFRTYCHSDETLMIAAVMKSFDQHIAMPADVAGGAMTLYIFKNPDDKTMSIMATSREAQPLESCLIFSGSNVQHFVRPTMMPPRDKTKDRET